MNKYVVTKEIPLEKLRSFELKIVGDKNSAEYAKTFYTKASDSQ